MAADGKDCGFVLIRARLGSKQEFEAYADLRINILDKDAKFKCLTSDGTQPAVFASILTKLAQAIRNEDPRVSLQSDTDNNKILG